MRAAFAFLLVCLCFTPSCAKWNRPSATPTKDFVDLTKTPWGLSRVELAEQLHIPPASSGPVILQARLYDHAAGILYVFVQDELACINIQVLQAGKKDTLTPLVARTEADLEARYGTPIIKQAVCPGEYGCIVTKWIKDKNTQVVLESGPLANGRHLTISYVSTGALSQIPAAQPIAKTQRKKGRFQPNISVN